MLKVPDRSEAAEYYFTYIDKVPTGDLLDVLEAQRADMLALFDGIRAVAFDRTLTCRLRGTPTGGTVRSGCDTFQTVPGH